MKKIKKFNKNYQKGIKKLKKIKIKNNGNY